MRRGKVAEGPFRAALGGQEVDAQNNSGGLPRGPLSCFARAVSYLFVAYIYDKRRFSPKAIVDFWSDAEQAFAGEKLVRVAVSPRVDAAFYFAGNFSTKTDAFGYGCEAMLLDEYAEGPATALRAASEASFQYAVWLSSDMFDYDVSMLYSAQGFEGRAIIDGRGERVSVKSGRVEHYQAADLALGPRELGFVSEGGGDFDEDAYQQALAEREEPFRPNLLVHDALGVTRGKVIDALHNAWGGKGEVLWPSGGPRDTAEMRNAILNAESPTMLGLPLWEHLAAEAKAAEDVQSAGVKSRKKKPKKA